MSASSAVTASTMRRVSGDRRSTRNATPTFSPRASALAAPKKLDPTIRPRATSSDHSTGALKVERSTTDTMTTARSAASSTAATASVTASSQRTGAEAPAVAVALMPLVPAKAGTQSQKKRKNWIPACAGMNGACVNINATLKPWST